MGKWSHLKGQFPDRVEHKEELKALFGQLPVDELESTVAFLAEVRKELKAKHKEVNEKYVAACAALLEQWETTGTTTKKRHGIGTLAKSDDVYASITDFEAFKQWAAEHGRLDLIKETCHQRTLSSEVKGFLEEGKEVPPGVSVYFDQTVKVTQA